MPRNIKGKIVLVPFPFDDLSATKERPALCLSRVIGPYRQVILAYISSQKPSSPLPSDLILDATNSDFTKTGLRIDSVIRLHQIATVRIDLITRELGDLPPDLQAQIDARLVRLFDLNL